MLGNVLWHLVYTDILGGGLGPQERLDMVWTFVNAEYSNRRTGTQFSNILLSMFTDEANPAASPPFLKGKAAENRHLVPILKDLWISKQRNPLEAHIGQTLHYLTEYYTIMDSTLPDGSYPPFLAK